MAAAPAADYPCTTCGASGSITPVQSTAWFEFDPNEHPRDARGRFAPSEVVNTSGVKQQAALDAKKFDRTEWPTKEIEQAASRWLYGLSKSERQALRDYTADKYFHGENEGGPVNRSLCSAEVNQGLRDDPSLANSSPEMRQAVANLDAAIKKAPVSDKPIITWSGVRTGDQETNAKIKSALDAAIGTDAVISRNSFMSATLNPISAVPYAAIMLELHSRNLAMLDDVSCYRGESEVLHPRGTCWHVRAATDSEFLYARPADDDDVFHTIRTYVLDQVDCPPSQASHFSFDPDEHPRDADGKFALKEGFAFVERQEDGSYRHKESGEPLPAEVAAHVATLKIPPAWQDVQLANDPQSPLQAVGVDKKGRAQYLYSAEHVAKAAAAKFERVKAMLEVLPSIRAKIDEAIAGPAGDAKEAAAVLKLIDRTGIRIGSEKDTKTSYTAIGASTLEAKHVKDLGDGKLRFAFTAKKGVRYDRTIVDPDLAAMLAPRIAAGGRLFNTTDGQVRDLLHSFDHRFKVKDFRTVIAGATALAAMDKIAAPKDAKALKKKIKEVAKAVSKRLGNTPAVAIKSYIPPEVFSAWRAKVEAKAKADEGKPKKKKRKKKRKKKDADTPVAVGATEATPAAPPFAASFDFDPDKHPHGEHGRWATTATGGTSLRHSLEGLKGDIARKAQEEYDAWQPNKDGVDDEFGGGGICDAVANHVAGIIAAKIPDAELIDGGQDGDDHAWTIVKVGTKAYGVDIAPGVYESGGGYSWKKIPGVSIKPSDVDIFEIDARDLDESRFDFDPSKHPRGERGRWADTASAGDGSWDVQVPSYVMDAITAKAGEPISKADLARLGGAVPGQRVDVSTTPGGGVRIICSGKEFFTRRVLDLDKKIIHNEGMVAAASGHGQGTRSLAEEVATGRRLGFNKILLRAGGSFGGTQNGYYTWPRLGFDGPLDSLRATMLAPRFASAKTVQELFAMPGGAEEWKKHGSGFEASFDMRDGSRSMAVLREYTKLKNLTVHFLGHESLGSDPILDSQDEAILTAIWARIVSEGWGWLTASEFKKKKPIDDELKEYLSGEWALVNSSNVDAIMWDKDELTLYIQYLDGSLYGYSPITRKMAIEMFNAPSHGSWVWDNLRVRGTVHDHQCDWWKIAGPEDDEEDDGKASHSAGFGFDPEQPRDNHGRWSEGGGNSAGQSSDASWFEPTQPSVFHDKFTKPPPELVQRARKWLTDVAEHDPDAIKTLDWYTDEGWDDLNHFVRDGKESSDEKINPRLPNIARSLQFLLANAPDAPEPITSWRGLRCSTAEKLAGVEKGLRAALQSGDTITIPGFNSSSLDPAFAANWSGVGDASNKEQSEADCVVLEIKSKRLTYVDSHSNNSGEREMLHPHNCHYKVTGYRLDSYDNGSRVMWARTYVLEEEGECDQMPEPTTSHIWHEWERPSADVPTRSNYSRDVDDQPRDDHGRWTEGGSVGSATPAGPTVVHQATNLLDIPDSVRLPANEWARQMVPTQKNALHWYTDDGFRDLNPPMRNGKINEMARWLIDKAALIQGAILDAPMADKPIASWRGLKCSTPEKLERIEAGLQAALATGQTITVPGFNSASLDPSLAAGWAGIGEMAGPGSQNKVVLEIHSKRMAYLEPMTYSQGEMEILHPHNATYKVVGRRLDLYSDAAILPGSLQEVPARTYVLEEVGEPERLLEPEPAPRLSLRDVIGKGAAFHDVSDQPRDAHGRWAEGGGGAVATASPPPAAAERPTPGKYYKGDAYYRVLAPDEVRPVRYINDPPESIRHPARAWAKGLPNDQREAIENYTEMSYFGLNKSLRLRPDGSALTPEQRKQFEAITAALKTAPISDQPFNSWRGLTCHTPGNQKLIEDALETALATGDPVQIPGFSSATLAPDMAANFSSKTKTILEIRSRRNSYIESITASDMEMEVLFPHNARFRVTGIHEDVPFETTNHKRRVVQRRIYTLEELDDQAKFYNSEQERDSHGRWTHGGALNQQFGPTDVRPRFESLPPDVEGVAFKWAKGLPDNQANAVFDYTGDGYDHVNRAMRNCPDTLDCLPDDTLVSATDINDAIRSFPPAKEPVTSWRAVDSSWPEKRHKIEDALRAAHQTGEVVKMPGFSSATVDSSLAAKHGGFMLEIHSRYGAILGPASQNPEENEVLFAHNSRFRVAEVHEAGLFHRHGGPPDAFTTFVLEAVDEPPPDLPRRLTNEERWARFPARIAAMPRSTDSIPDEEIPFFNPDEARDSHGRWVQGGVGSYRVSDAKPDAKDEAASDHISEKDHRELCDSLRKTAQAWRDREDDRREIMSAFASAAKDGWEKTKDGLLTAVQALAPVEEAVAEHVKSGFAHLPATVREPVKGALTVAFSPWLVAQNMAKEVAKSTGATAEATEALGRHLMEADIIGAKGALIAAPFFPHAAAVGYWIPWGTAAYLGLSLAKHPLYTMRAAGKAVVSTVAAIPGLVAKTPDYFKHLGSAVKRDYLHLLRFFRGRKSGKAAMAETESPAPAATDVLEWLDAAAKEGRLPWADALLTVAMEMTHDLGAALALARLTQVTYGKAAG